MSAALLTHLCSDLAGVGLGRAGSHQQGILQGLGQLLAATVRIWV